MKKETWLCDICGSEPKLEMISIAIFARQGTSDDAFSLKDHFSDYRWKYKTEKLLNVCENCVGEKITRCWGDTAPFKVPSFQRLLEKIGILKPKAKGAGE